MAQVLPYFTALLSRLLLSTIFLTNGVNKRFNWAGTADQMTGEGMVPVEFFLAVAVLFEMGGSLSVLLGWKARLAALALLAFLVPVTLIFHGFCQYEGQAQTEQMILFV